MGMFANVCNMPISDLKYIEVGSTDYEPGDNKKNIETEKQRQDVLNKLSEKPGTVKLWATRNFNFVYGKEIVSVQEGENVFPYATAIFLMLDYGVNNRYGNLAREKDAWVWDEPTFKTPKLGEKDKPFNFSKKPKPKEATEA